MIMTNKNMKSCLSAKYVQKRLEWKVTLRIMEEKNITIEIVLSKVKIILMFIKKHNIKIESMSIDDRKVLTYLERS